MKESWEGLWRDIMTFLAVDVILSRICVLWLLVNPSLTSLSSSTTKKHLSSFPNMYWHVMQASSSCSSSEGFTTCHRRRVSRSEQIAFISQNLINNVKYRITHKEEIQYLLCQMSTKVKQAWTTVISSRNELDFKYTHREKLHEKSRRHFSRSRLLFEEEESRKKVNSSTATAFAVIVVFVQRFVMFALLLYLCFENTA